MSKWLVPVLCSLCLTLSPALQAQDNADEDVAEIRRNVQLFAGLLREGLELEPGAGLFGRHAQPVSARYLLDQGVVIEINSPLRNRAASMGLRQLRTSLQDLSRQIDRISSDETVVRRPDARALRETMPRFNEGAVDEFMQSLRQQLAEIDREDFAVVDDALRQARDAARHLHSAGELSDERLGEVNQDLAALRQQLSEQIAGFRQLQRDSRSEDGDEELTGQLAGTLEQLQQALPRLRDEAQAWAGDLRQRSEALREEQRAQWREDVAAFEHRLFSVLCDFGGGLRSLPQGERLNIVLNGLGREDDGQQSLDRIHVLEREDLLQCQRGDLDADGLRAASRSYDF